MKLKKHIPNVLTLLNLLSGAVGVVLIFKGNFSTGAMMILLAALFDFLDGFVARILKAHSPIGKELDSLADMVSFGFLPSIIIYMLLEQSTSNEIIPFVAFLIAAFSAVRLAKFNVDERQTDYFIGLPTPANAILICSFPLMMESGYYPFLVNPYFLVIFTIVFSLLLVANIKLISLKFKSYGWNENKFVYLLIIISVVLFFILYWAAIPLIILLYLIFSIFRNYFGGF